MHGIKKCNFLIEDILNGDNYTVGRKSYSAEKSFCPASFNDKNNIGITNRVKNIAHRPLCIAAEDGTGNQNTVKTQNTAVTGGKVCSTSDQVTNENNNNREKQTSNIISVSNSGGEIRGREESGPDVITSTTQTSLRHCDEISDDDDSNDVDVDDEEDLIGLSSHQTESLTTFSFLRVYSTCSTLNNNSYKLNKNDRPKENMRLEKNNCNNQIVTKPTCVLRGIKLDETENFKRMEYLRKKSHLLGVCGSGVNVKNTVTSCHPIQENSILGRPTTSPKVDHMDVERSSSREERCSSFEDMDEFSDEEIDVTSDDDDKIKTNNSCTQLLIDEKEQLDKSSQFLQGNYNHNLISTPSSTQITSQSPQISSRLHDDAQIRDLSCGLSLRHLPNSVSQRYRIESVPLNESDRKNLSVQPAGCTPYLTPPELRVLVGQAPPPPPLGFLIPNPRNLQKCLLHPPHHLYHHHPHLASHVNRGILSDLYYNNRSLNFADHPALLQPPMISTPMCGTTDTSPAAFHLRMKCRRNRTVYSEHHLSCLESQFERQKYLTTKDRTNIARQLGLSQIQVKTWYQNRRMKWKKQVLQEGGTKPPTKPKGRPMKSEEEQT